MNGFDKFDCEQRWEQVSTALGKYYQTWKYVAPCPHFNVVEGDCSGWSKEQRRFWRPQGFSSWLKGLYLIYDRSGRLIYVGKTHTRFSIRFYYHRKRMDCYWFDVIPLDNNLLIDCLEPFLISQLQPPRNIRLK